MSRKRVLEPVAAIGVFLCAAIVFYILGSGSTIDGPQGSLTNPEVSGLASTSSHSAAANHESAHAGVDAGMTESADEAVAFLVAEVRDLLEHGLEERAELGFQVSACAADDRQCSDALSLSYLHVLDTAIRPAFVTDALSIEGAIRAFGPDAVDAILVAPTTRRIPCRTDVRGSGSMSPAHGAPFHLATAPGIARPNPKNEPLAPAPRIGSWWDGIA